MNKLIDKHPVSDNNPLKSICSFCQSNFTGVIVTPTGVKFDFVFVLLSLWYLCDKTHVVKAPYF